MKIGLRWMTLGLGLNVAAATAGAQEIDLTYTQPPVVMLAIDSSGSMQWSGTRLPRDDLGNVPCGLQPGEKSREIVVKEVLTGTFNGYTLQVNSANQSTSFSNVSQRGQCLGNTGSAKHTPLFTSQSTDGLLDTYRERLRFALSTFDNSAGLRNSGSDWSYPGTTDPAGWDGYYAGSCGTSCASSSCSSCSGGSGASGCVTRVIPNITTALTRGFCYGNQGIRSLRGSPCPTTTSGCLISAGAVGSDITAQNDLIQTQVMGIWSNGGTPLAGMLKDIRWWFDNNPDVAVTSSSSTFMKCRKNFTIVVTDGIPNQGCGYSSVSEGKPEVCFNLGSCTSDANCPAPIAGQSRQWFCKSYSGGSNSCYHVDYPNVELGAPYQASKLLNPPSGGVSVKTFVVGFDLPAALSCNSDSDCMFGQSCKTAPEGFTSPTGKRCTCASDANCDIGESCQPSAQDPSFTVCRLGQQVSAIAAAGGGQAFFVQDPTTLRTSLSQIFNSLLPASTSRTRVTSTTAVAPLVSLPSQFPQPNKAALFIFEGAFTVPATSAYWAGFLQRVAIGNIGTASSPIIGPITNATNIHGTVRFDTLLNTQPSPIDDQGAAYTRSIYFARGSQVLEFTKTNVTLADVGAASTTERDNIVNFIRGEVGSARANNRLGAIYHASPTVLEPPVLDLPLQSYRTYKAQTRIQNRPPIVFIGDNLGMLHAFNGTTAKEEWAFIPSALLPTLKQQMSGFTWGIDSTPVARDIQMTSVGADSDPYANWRGVVVFSLGQGGSATVALDVTNPIETTPGTPAFKLLWQFDETTSVPQNKLGVSYPSPTLGTVFLDDAANGYGFQERAIAIIPGGKTPSGGTVGQGEDVWVLDLFPPTTAPKIMKSFPGYAGSGGQTGSCSAVDDFPGSFITRVYCGTADSRLMRLNLGAQTIGAWSADANWYDLYGSTAGTRLPIYSAPALANRSNGDLMVIFGNGDQNDLENTTETRVAFVEESPTVDTTGTTTGFTALEQKLLRLSNGEKMTGSPVVYNKVAYWATFVPDTSSTCSFGRTRIWGVSFDTFDKATADGGVQSVVPGLSSACGPDGIFDTADDVQGVTTSCLLPVGSVSFGFDLVRSPSAVVAPSGSVAGTSTPVFGAQAGQTTVGGDLKLVFQTGTGSISTTSKLYDAQLTPPGAQTIQVGAINIPDSATRARIISWGKVNQ